jgi:Holliday junction DNA helicase RuvB
MKEMLRPLFLRDFKGQKSITDNLEICIAACKKRKESLDHVLLYGPPGLGKTTLSNIIANELGVKIKTISSSSLDKIDNLNMILKSLEKNSVLFIDEIHRLSKKMEENLYIAMDEFKINFDFTDYYDEDNKNFNVKIKNFTLIGATTRYDLLGNAFRSRFGLSFNLKYYNNHNMIKIIKRNSKLLKIPIIDKAYKLIAKCSRNTPRNCNFLLNRIRDFAETKNNGIIDLKITKLALKKLNFDKNGLNILDQKILKTIIKHFKGGPIGIKTLSLIIGENINTIEEYHEPFLIKNGYLILTPKGRKVTKLALKHYK